MIWVSYSIILFFYYTIPNFEWQAKDDEIEYLRLEIKKLKTDLEEAKNSLSEKNRQVEEHEKDLDIANKAASTAREHQREARRIKV